MNKQKTAKVSLGRILLLVTALLIICTGSAVAQQSLQGLAKEYGLDWAVGRWTATTDNGTEIQLVYRWELDGHLITADLKMGEYASRGMIFYVPGEEKATQVSVDNRGGRSKATWELLDDKLVSKSEHVDAEGNTRKMGIMYSKVDARTMKVAVYGVGQDNELADEPWGTMEFKRQVRKPRRKTVGKDDTEKSN